MNIKTKFFLLLATLSFLFFSTLSWGGEKLLLEIHSDDPTEEYYSIMVKTDNFYVKYYMCQNQHLRCEILGERFFTFGELEQYYAGLVPGFFKDIFHSFIKFEMFGLSTFFLAQLMSSFMASYDKQINFFTEMGYHLQVFKERPYFIPLIPLGVLVGFPLQVYACFKTQNWQSIIISLISLAGGYFFYTRDYLWFMDSDPEIYEQLSLILNENYPHRMKVPNLFNFKDKLLTFFHEVESTL